MAWTMGNVPTIRGYKYSFNGYGRLTAADYGEGISLSDRKDRYTERFLDFMRNGGIRRLQRHGLKADGVYGKVDNLHISYDGNRITTVLEDADQVTHNGSMDYPGEKHEMAFEYNKWGALIKDESRGITDITYDDLGNQVMIRFKDKGLINNVYSATGEKLKTMYRLGLTFPADTIQGHVPSGGNHLLFSYDVTQYHGPVIYHNKKVAKVLFPGGYATINGTSATFHYYTQDYLGNNRALIHGSTGLIEQRVAYYPYGGVIADLGFGLDRQQYKFGGKELMTANGLNEYDFGARRYYQAVPTFTSIDPMCEDTRHLSPYLYCGNNPVNAFDPDGRSTWVTDIGDGKYKVVGGDLNDNDKRVYMCTIDKNGNLNIKGKTVGITATMYSFYDSDLNNGKGEWMTNSIIDSNDMSGDSFLQNIVHDNPPLFNDYMKNARNGGCYDFKSTNGGQKRIEGIDYYRGMPIGETGDGLPIFASARDVGNIAAGYIAAVNGLSWKQARRGFDGYQSKGSGIPAIEGLTTRSAEAYGYRIGYNNTSPFQQGVNLRHSINEGIKTIWKSLKSMFNGF